MADSFPLFDQGSAMEKKTMLVVDDDEAIRLLCHEVLSDDGYHIVEARDCEEAIKKIEQTKPDIVILDIRMGYAPIERQKPNDKGFHCR